MTGRRDEDIGRQVLEDDLGRHRPVAPAHDARVWSRACDELVVGFHELVQLVGEPHAPVDEVGEPGPPEGEQVAQQVGSGGAVRPEHADVRDGEVGAVDGDRLVRGLVVVEEDECRLLRLEEPLVRRDRDAVEALDAVEQVRVPIAEAERTRPRGVEVAPAGTGARRRAVRPRPSWSSLPSPPRRCR
jgi:hypothetical protein